MFEELVLSPEELYYLAKACNGKHLNYDYITMMPDIQQRAAMYQDSCAVSLEKKGLVEDFWGEISVPDEVKAFLNPIWNGDFESSAARITLGEQPMRQIIYSHRLQDQFRLVIHQEDGIHILAADEAKLEMLAYSLMPGEYEKRSVPEETLISGTEPKEMILLKNILTNGERAIVEQFYLISGWICRQEAEKGYRILSAEDFYSIAVRVLKGV